MLSLMVALICPSSDGKYPFRDRFRSENQNCLLEVGAYNLADNMLRLVS